MLFGIYGNESWSIRARLQCSAPVAMLLWPRVYQPSSYPVFCKKWNNSQVLRLNHFFSFVISFLFILTFLSSLFIWETIRHSAQVQFSFDSIWKWILPQVTMKLFHKEVNWLFFVYHLDNCYVIKLWTSSHFTVTMFLWIGTFTIQMPIVFLWE